MHAMNEAPTPRLTRVKDGYTTGEGLGLGLGGEWSAGAGVPLIVGATPSSPKAAPTAPKLATKPMALDSRRGGSFCDPSIAICQVR